MLNEPRLEPIARYFRFKKSLKYTTRTKSINIIDIGCGPEIRFYKFLLKNNIKIDKYIGIDPLINSNYIKNNKSVRLIKNSVSKKLPIKSNFADYVFAFAMLEHINHPKELLREMVRIIKPKGKIILTTPTPKSKKILEFLSFKLNLISPREIKEHKNYFDKEKFLKLVKGNKKIIIKHEYFEFGLNNIFVIKKRN